MADRHQHPARLWHLHIVQGLRRRQNLGVDVGSGQGFCLGLVACIGTHHTIGVAVHLGNDHFPVLPGQGGHCLELLGGFIRVQLVNGEGEGGGVSKYAVKGDRKEKRR